MAQPPQKKNRYEPRPNNQLIGWLRAQEKKRKEEEEEERETKEKEEEEERARRWASFFDAVGEDEDLPMGSDTDASGDEEEDDEYDDESTSDSSSDA